MLCSRLLPPFPCFSCPPSPASPAPLPLLLLLPPGGPGADRAIRGAVALGRPRPGPGRRASGWCTAARGQHLRAAHGLGAQPVRGPVPPLHAFLRGTLRRRPTHLQPPGRPSLSNTWMRVACEGMGGIGIGIGVQVDWPHIIQLWPSAEEPPLGADPSPTILLSPFWFLCCGFGVLYCSVLSPLSSGGGPSSGYQ